MAPTKAKAKNTDAHDLDDLSNVAGSCKDWAEVLTEAVSHLQQTDPVGSANHVRVLQRAERAVREVADRLTAEGPAIVAALDASDVGPVHGPPKPQEDQDG